VLAGCVAHRPLESYSADELQAEYESRKCERSYPTGNPMLNDKLEADRNHCLRERRELWEALQRRLAADRATMPACVAAQPFPRTVEYAHAHTEAERLDLILTALLRSEEFRTPDEYQRCVEEICTWAAVRRINTPACGKRS
jgi:hypothetical protein